MAQDTERQSRGGYLESPATLGRTSTAKARVIVTCRNCGHEVEADLKHQILRQGGRTVAAEMGRSPYLLAVRLAPR